MPPGRTSGPKDWESLRCFPQAEQTDLAAPSKLCRYVGPSTALHLRAPAALPDPLGQPWSLREKHLLRRPMASGGEAIEGSKARSGTKKRAFVSLQPMGLCCINQLSQEPNTIKPKQSPRLGGITLMYIHWVMPHLWEGTPEGRRGKMSMAHQCASFFHRWAGRPTPLCCSFAASPAEQRARSRQKRSDW